MKHPRRNRYARKPPKGGDGQCYCGNPAIGVDSSGPYCARCKEIEAYNNPHQPKPTDNQEATEEGTE